MEKENADLKNDIRLVSKRLESRMTELEHAKKATDVASRQLAEALRKVTKLDEECTRLRSSVRKKLPSRASILELSSHIGFNYVILSIWMLVKYPASYE